MAWPGVGIGALARMWFVGVPWETATVLGSVVVGAAVLGTWFRPGLLVGALVKRDGKKVLHLRVRRVTGVLAVLATVPLFTEPLGL